jgi:VIT1/CCC1 family predicted Fe2+/Mn2+ transporter
MGSVLDRLKGFLERYLRPEDSLLEVVGGVIVVLATANTLTVTRDRAGEDAIIEAAFTVAIAWGLVDAGLGLLGTVYHRKSLDRTIRDAASADDAAAIVSSALGDELLDLADPTERDAFVRHLAAQATSAPAKRKSLTRDDLIGAVLTAVLMFSATLPLTIPLYLIDNPDTGVVAMNGMAFVFLFIIGWLLADYTTMRKARFGLELGRAALALTALTMIFD